MAAARLLRRRLANRALLSLAGLALAVFGQGFIAARFVLDGLLLYAIGLGLAWGSLPNSELSATASSEASPARRSFRLPLAIAAAALAANGVGLALFGTGGNPNVAWLLYLASVVAVILAAWRLDGPRLRLAIGRPGPYGIALLGILAVGLVFRVYRIDSLPAGLWWDEAFCGIEVERILTDPTYRPVFVGGRAQGPTALWYVMAPFVVLLGPTSLALRASAILAGVVGVLATYLLGRELFGRRVGLVAAGIIAVLAWHVNFSRIGFNAIWSVTLDAFAAYLLVRGLRTRRFLDFALGGAALGAGLNMYYTTRLLPVVLGAYLLHRLAVERGELLRRALPGLVAFALVTLLAVTPLAQFALVNPAEFGSRLSEASVFREAEALQSVTPILENLRDHVLMFNYAGDRNGRHNLPGAPMLDQAVGAAFVVGLGLCLRRARRPEFSFLLTWLVVMLGGGVLSVRFESPQALRTIDETTAVALVGALPIVALWQGFEALPIGRVRVRLAGLGRPTVAALVAAACLVFAAGFGYERYFVRQANDFGVWASFSTAETAVAGRLNALPADTQVYLDEPLLGHPTIGFLTRRPTDFRRFEAATSLPFPEDAPAVVFLSPEQEAAVGYIQRIYPGAKVDAVQPEFDAPQVLLITAVDADDIAAVRGALASYYPGDGFGLAPARTEAIAALDLDPASPPLPYPYSVEVRGTLVAAAYGEYALGLVAPAGAELWLDETRVLGSGERVITKLARGVHTVRLRARLTAPARVTVLWQRPGEASDPEPVSDALFAPSVPATGLRAAYYPNSTWSGEPTLQQIDPELSFRFHFLHLPRPYSVEWRGKLIAPREGDYRFAVEASSGAWVFVDERQVATSEGSYRQIADGAPIRLGAGLHDVRVRFVDTVDHSLIRVYWTAPGEERRILPGELLLPPRGAYPDPVAITAPPREPPSVWVEGAIPTLPLRLVGTLGLGAQLRDPRGVAVDAAGNVYVADTGNARVVKLSPAGEFLGGWGTRGTGPGAFQDVVDLTVEASGAILALDAEDGYVQRLSPDGAFLARFAGLALSPYHPRGIGADDFGEIALADTGSSRIVLLGQDGRLNRRLGQRGSGSGQLVEPTDVVRLSDGGFVVVDSANDRALRLDPDFRLAAEWPIPPGESVWGPHLALDADGNIYVSDPDGGRVVLFDPDGKVLGQVGGAGELRRPVGLAADDAGRLYVADAEAGLIAVYERAE